MEGMQFASNPGIRLTLGLAKLRLWKPATHFARACKLLQADSPKVSQAQAELHLASRLAPAWAEPYFLLAQCSEALDEIGDQEENLKQVLLRNPRHQLAEKSLMKLRAWRHEPVMRAWHLYYSGQFELAIEAFGKAKSKIGQQVSDQQKAEIEGGIGWCMHDLKRWPEAVDAFTSALEKQAKLAHAWKGLGIAEFHSQRPIEARRALEHALELEPQLQDARAFLGWCDYAEGNYQAAAAHFEMANEGNPLLGDAWWGTAWCLWHTDKTEETRAAFRQAFEVGAVHPGGAKAAQVLSRDEKYRDLLLPFGFALLEAGKPEAALLRFERVLGHALRLEVVSGRAAALLKLDRPADAESALGMLEEPEMDQRISALPNCTPRLLRAEAALALNRPESALVLLKRAVSADGTLHHARLKLNQLLEKVGGGQAGSEHKVIWTVMQFLAEEKFEDAWHSLQQAEDSENYKWKLELLRARVRLAQGRQKEALIHFEQSRKAAPHRADAAQEEARLLETMDRQAEAKSLLANYPALLQTS